MSPIVGTSTSHVRNSAKFANFIAGQTLPNETTLVLLDAVSLFTNVPADFAVRVACEKLSFDSSLAEWMALSIEQLVNFLKFCL